ncbi:MAG TPA: hypothetical protein VHS31_06775 [Tepidisphaeraceae bacterium]|jgi:hypothetical protein|nr:hypothetical protein [Tepidisphaeraceae bacterium]
MEAKESGRISCGQCGKTYRWKPEFSGRKVKCACGQVIICESEPSSGQSADGLYELAPGATPAPVAAVAPVAIPYRSAKHDPDVVQQYFPNPTIDLHAPLWLIGGAVVVQVIAALLFSRRPDVSAIMALVEVGSEMIGGTIIMLVGILLAAKFRGIQFGPFWAAVLKLSAIAVAPSAVMTMIGPIFMFIPFGGLLVWLVGFVAYFALLGTLFEMDQDDTWYCVLVIFVLKIGFYFILLASARFA